MPGGSTLTEAICKLERNRVRLNKMQVADIVIQRGEGVPFHYSPKIDLPHHQERGISQSQTRSQTSTQGTSQEATCKTIRSPQTR